MHRMHRLIRPATQSSRGGFTIIELLMVIIIISILVALLFPAIQNGFRSAREAEVVAEIANFDEAITSFKSRYGIDPPSFIVLYEQGAGVGDPDWSVDTTSGLTDGHRIASRALIRQMWPDFNFAASRDINGDGDSDDYLILNGAECLVFFLGGVCETNVVDNQGNLRPSASAGDPIEWWGPLGFSANPNDPFRRGGNRVGPFFGDFVGGDGGRLRDVASAAPDPDEQMPEYLDPLSSQVNPYLYVSSYDGAGYRPWGRDGTAGNIDDEIVGLSIHYLQDDGNPSTTSTLSYAPQTYQIISPGFDTEYGTGGEYNGELIPSARSFERDNITNFQGGRLN